MSQQSEECPPESASAEPNAASSARVVHLKSRQYDLQKAIQQRAQESVEREAALDEEQRRPKPLKWAIALVLAAIPVGLTLTAVDGFLRAFHKYMGMAVESVQRQQEEAAAAGSQDPVPSSQPGVVMLQPLTVADQARPQSAAPQTQPPAAAADPKE